MPLWEVFYLVVCGAVITGVVATSSENSEAESPTGQCNEVGFKCRSCSSFSIDIHRGYGVETAVVQCNTGAGEQCSEVLKRCSTTKSHCSQDGLFECHQEGIFPHPTDCNVYYECVSVENGILIAERHDCSPGTVYNAKSYNCESTEDKYHCEKASAWGCHFKSVYGRVIPLLQNPNIFYACRNGVPNFYRCVEGADYYYDAEILQCVKNKSAEIAAPVERDLALEGLGEKNTTCEQDRATPTETPPVSSGLFDTCIDGLQYLPAPFYCSHYYKCWERPMAEWKYCGYMVYFDREKGECVSGICPYDDTHSVLCASREGYYPLPKLCNAWYHCAYNGLRDVGRCGFREYFHRESKRCVIGDCPYTDF